MIFCNKGESTSFTGAGSMLKAAEALKKYAKVFVITDGVNGSLVFDGYKEHQSEGFDTVTIDTNGAGDMFAGAFLYAISSGRDYIWAASLANYCA